MFSELPNGLLYTPSPPKPNLFCQNKQVSKDLFLFFKAQVKSKAKPLKSQWRSRGESNVSPITTVSKDPRVSEAPTLLTFPQWRPSPSEPLETHGYYFKILNKSQAAC